MNVTARLGEDGDDFREPGKGEWPESSKPRVVSGVRRLITRGVVVEWKTRASSFWPEALFFILQICNKKRRPREAAEAASSTFRSFRWV